jgi:hypothetical protein
MRRSRLVGVSLATTIALMVACQQDENPLAKSSLAVGGDDAAVDATADAVATDAGEPSDADVPEAGDDATSDGASDCVAVYTIQTDGGTEYIVMAAPASACVNATCPSNLPPGGVMSYAQAEESMGRIRPDDLTGPAYYLRQCFHCAVGAPFLPMVGWNCDCAYDMTLCTGAALATAAGIAGAGIGVATAETGVGAVAAAISAVAAVAGITVFLASIDPLFTDCSSEINNVVCNALESLLNDLNTGEQRIQNLYNWVNNNQAAVNAVLAAGGYAWANAGQMLTALQGAINSVNSAWSTLRGNASAVGCD